MLLIVRTAIDSGALTGSARSRSVIEPSAINAAIVRPLLMSSTELKRIDGKDDVCPAKASTGESFVAETVTVEDTERLAVSTPPLRVPPESLS